MSDLYDLHGMEPADAKDYILSVMAELRQKRQLITGLSEQKALWESRTALAREKGSEPLAVQAQEKAAEMAASIQQTELECQELEVGLEHMKNQLKSPTMATPSLVDADALLDEIQMMSGEEPDTLSPQMDRLDADAALEALKAKMKQT